MAALLAAAGVYAGWKILDSKHQIAFDLGVIREILPLKKYLEQYIGTDYNVGRLWMDAVKKFGKHESLCFEGRTLTFNEVDEWVNKLAVWASSRGFKKGDTVALVMENSLEFLVTFIAMSKLGIITAWINNNLRHKGLLHCLSASKSSAVFFTPALHEHISEIWADLEAAKLPAFAFGEGHSPIGENISEQVLAQPNNPPSPDILKGVMFSDVSNYIYTSGTTGLPKAAVITNQRIIQLGATFGMGNQCNTDDRVYCVLPLYHSSSALGFMSMMVTGHCFIFRKKFSASVFWKDITEYRATGFQYIGELCRYLLQHPPTPYDRSHKIRFCVGNGLRPEIWAQFQERFNLPLICEFYGATEGNISFLNKCRTKEDRGAVGRQGYLLTKITGNKFVKFDVDKDDVIRGKDGFCIECAPGEPGELLGLIDVKKSALSKFEGYTDEASTKKKILTDVFVKGDKYFRTGDLLMKDARGYVYFVDRIGDTFRWKGENVSTTEVAEVISVFPGIHEANVYGVQLPGKDGRACMAGIVCDDNLDLKKFYKHVSDNLPSYAVPMFLRKLKVVEITGTFKHQKMTLRKEGFDLSVVNDPIFWLNPSTKQYEPFTHEALNQITSGKAKL